MKASVEWLKQFSDIEISNLELIDKLTLSGTKVETLDQIGNDIENVVVGKILSIEKHPDADKLVVTKVDVKSEVIQIVTGAKNISVGDIIPVCKSGAKLPGGIEIKKGKLRGVESCGMMCSIGELNLKPHDYPEQIEDGIMILPKSYEKYLGLDIVDVLDIREDIIDFEITPNRVDCLGVEGIGREVAVTLGTDFKNPNSKLDNLEVENKDEIEGLRVEVKDSSLCPRYMARVVTDLKIEPSPVWMQKRLKALGIRSINNVVDITNYVMLEMGQPMHAFDMDYIKGKKIIVRSAKDGEKLTTLDGNEHILNSEDIVIANEDEAIGLAGIMGGLNSEIREDTKTLVFESAIFKRANIRKTSKRQNLRTESSSRFEKGLSPENAKRAINRACDLIEELGAGKVASGIIDIYGQKQEKSIVKLDLNRINTLIGIDFTYDYVIDILKKLEFEIKVDGNDTYVIAPFFRLDIESNADLAEEVLRFYGYDKLPSKLANSECTIGLRTKPQKLHVEIENFLKLNGFSEIYTYGFISEDELEKSGLPDEVINNKIEILNPLSDEYRFMRPSTIPSILKTLKTNQNMKNEDVKLFDISRIYLDKEKVIEKLEVPKEEKILTIGFYGELDFYNLKGLLENILEISNINSYQLKEEQNNLSYHPGKCANICIGKDIIGTFGEVHPKVLENFKLNKCYIAQLNLEKMQKYSKDIKKYEEISKFPTINRDISVVIDENILVGDIQNAINTAAKKYIKQINLFDIYRDEKLGENKKSLAFNLKFQDKSKTLTDEIINEQMQRIISKLEKDFDAKLR